MMPYLPQGAVVPNDLGRQKGKGAWCRRSRPSRKGTAPEIGHVVLPLLQTGGVEPGRGGRRSSPATAAPGPSPARRSGSPPCPGTVANQPPSGVTGGLSCLVAIVVPGLVLVPGCLPLRQDLRQRDAVRPASSGVSATIAGVRLAARHDLVVTDGVHAGAELALAAVAMLLMA